MIDSTFRCPLNLEAGFDRPNRWVSHPRDPQSLPLVCSHCGSVSGAEVLQWIKERRVRISILPGVFNRVNLAYDTGTLLYKDSVSGSMCGGIQTIPFFFGHFVHIELCEFISLWEENSVPLSVAASPQAREQFIIGVKQLYGFR